MNLTFLYRVLLPLLLALPLCSCHREQGADVPASARLEIALHVPAPVAAKAEEGDVAASEAERTVHTLHIWVFHHDDGTLIGYLSPSVNNLGSGITERYSIYLENALARQLADNLVTVDVYVAANPDGVTLPDGTAVALSEHTARADLDVVCLQGERFGTLSPQDAVPAGGLPMSAVRKGVTVGGAFPVFSVETLQLTRAVSKIRFVFCQMASTADGSEQPVGSYAVTDIQLDGGQIAHREGLFNPTAAAVNLQGYAPAATRFPVPTALALHPAPASLAFRSAAAPEESAQAYESRVDAAVAEGRLTQEGPFYLRESDRQLQGVITYSANGQTGKTASFVMDAAGDFARNHSWIVFGYFIGGRLVVRPTLVPWIAGGDRYAHFTLGSTTMNWNSYLRYDEDRNASTWDDTYVTVAFGTAATGEPLRSPLILLTTTTVDKILVQVNNDHFHLVEAELDSDHRPVAFHVHEQTFVIEAGNNVKTGFYLVPVSNDIPTDRLAKVYLTEISTLLDLPPTNIPYNHDLPGDEDHTSIRYRFETTAVFDANKDLTKEAGSAQTAHYWIEDNV